MFYSGIAYKQNISFLLIKLAFAIVHNFVIFVVLISVDVILSFANFNYY